MDSMNLDAVSISFGSLYGPAGIGALVLKNSSILNLKTKNFYKVK